jgi:hypothetical protein
VASCTDCGIDEESISVSDAVSAIRTFPRRYREALARFPPDALRQRPDPESWSALEHAARARDVLQQLAAALPRVLEDPGVRFAAFDTDESAARSREPASDPELVQAGIESASEALADRADSTPWKAWEREFTAGADTHPASWIVAHAAHEGSHHLREIERIGRRVGAAEDD